MEHNAFAVPGCINVFFKKKIEHGIITELIIFPSLMQYLSNLYMKLYLYITLLFVQSSLSPSSQCTYCSVTSILLFGHINDLLVYKVRSD